MKSIFDISQEWLLVMDELEENGGEITPDLEHKLEFNEGEFEQKAEAYAVIIRRMLSEAAQLKEEEQRLAKMRKVKENTAERLKERLAQALEIREIYKLDLGSFKLGFRRSETVEILDPETVEDEYKVHSWKPNLKQIKEDLKAGVKLPFATIKENQNLQIR